MNPGRVEPATSADPASAAKASAETSSAEGSSAEGRGGLGTVRNAVRLLELLGEGPAYQQLTDLAERSNMSIPTVHRLLRSLVLADLAVQDPRTSRYGLGPELTRLSNHYLSRLPLLGALAPYLGQLRDQIGTTIHVETLVHGEVIYIDRVDGSDRGPYRDTHRVGPALQCAGGRLLAARGTDEEWDRALETADELDRSVATQNGTRAAWASADHLAHEPDDPTQAAEVAVPVTDGQGVTVAALAASLDRPDDPETIRRAVGHLARAARAAGRTLGHA